MGGTANYSEAITSTEEDIGYAEKYNLPDDRALDHDYLETGYNYWELEKYPSELQQAARIMLIEEHHLTDGYEFYISDDAWCMLHILKQLKEAFQGK